MLNMIETWNALWTNISPKTCGGKLNKAAGKRGRSRRRSAYALRRSRNTARAGRSPRSPRSPNCAVFWTARRMIFWGSGTELFSCRTLHRKNCSPAKGARVERRAPPVIYAEILFLPLPSSPPLAPPRESLFKAPLCKGSCHEVTEGLSLVQNPHFNNLPLSPRIGLPQKREAFLRDIRKGAFHPLPFRPAAPGTERPPSQAAKNIVKILRDGVSKYPLC